MYPTALIVLVAFTRSSGDHYEYDATRNRQLEHGLVDPRDHNQAQLVVSGGDRQAHSVVLALQPESDLELSEVKGDATDRSVSG